MTATAVMLWTAAIEAILFPFAVRERMKAAAAMGASGRRHRNQWPAGKRGAR